MVKLNSLKSTARHVLELGPPIVFFVMYLQLRDAVVVIAGTEYTGFVVATVIFVPILLLAMGGLLWLTGKLSRLQIFTAVMVVVFGGLTAWLNDERFFKIKTTIVYAVFVGILGFGLLRGKSYLEWVLSDFMPMTHKGWMILTRRLTLCFAVLALANEIVWRTLSTDVWVKIETFVFPAVLFVFLWWQILALQSQVMGLEISDQDKESR
ncbi:MAG: septation protein IspZ [Aestuariivita sp.]|nr:septation protein IspZ [Aestuariivita sp.]